MSLQAGETHDPEHEIEEMVAGTAVRGLSLEELQLRQARWRLGDAARQLERNLTIAERVTRSISGPRRRAGDGRGIKCRWPIVSSRRGHTRSPPQCDCK